MGTNTIRLHCVLRAKPEKVYNFGLMISGVRWN